MQKILLNTESEEHTVQTVGTNRSLRRLLPFKHMGVGMMDGMEWGELAKRREMGRENEVQEGKDMYWGRWGSWDTYMVSWWISFIGFCHFLSGSFFVFISPHSQVQQW